MKVDWPDYWEVVSRGDWERVRELVGGGIEMVPVKVSWFVEIEHRLKALEEFEATLLRDVDGKALVTDSRELDEFKRVHFAQRAHMERLEQWLLACSDANQNHEKRLAAVEDLLKPVAPEVVEKTMSRYGVDWTEMSPAPLESGVRFPPEGVEEVPQGWAGEGEIWRTGTIAVDHQDIEGLDLQDFKTLLRVKFASLGDELVTAFLKEREAKD